MNAYVKRGGGGGVKLEFCIATFVWNVDRGFNFRARW